MKLALCSREKTSGLAPLIVKWDQNYVVTVQTDYITLISNPGFSEPRKTALLGGMTLCKWWGPGRSFGRPAHISLGSVWNATVKAMPSAKAVPFAGARSTRSVGMSRKHHGTLAMQIVLVTADL